MYTGPMNFRSCCAALFLVFSCALIAGCDARAADKEEIQQVYEDFNDCNNNRNGDSIVSYFTKESFEHNERMLKVGLDGSPEEVRAMPLNDRLEVLRMRLQATRA